MYEWAYVNIHTNIVSRFRFIYFAFMHFFCYLGFLKLNNFNQFIEWDNDERSKGAVYV